MPCLAEGIRPLLEDVHQGGPFIDRAVQAGSYMQHPLCSTITGQYSHDVMRDGVLWFVQCVVCRVLIRSLFVSYAELF